MRVQSLLSRVYPSRHRVARSLAKKSTKRWCFAAHPWESGRVRPDPRVREIKPGDVVSGTGWTVTVGLAAHVQPYLECLAFRLDSAEGSVCYTGDSGRSDAIVELARGCDVLIHMNHHFSGTEPSAA